MKPQPTRFKKFLFVGLGGAGQRHLRIFKKLLPAGAEFSTFRSTRKTPLLRPDFSAEPNGTVEETYGLSCFNTLEEALESQPDVAVISNPTSLHYEVARKAAQKKINLFVEKSFSHNLDGFPEFQDLVLKNQLQFYVAFNRRFHPLLQRIKALLEEGTIGKPIHATFNVGSYLPSWHPYENFLDLYACRKDLGGGVLLTEIHELDLCHWFFGLPKSVYCTGGNWSDVPMDVEDTAQVTLNYKDFACQVNLCFMQKEVRRDLSISGTAGFLEWTQTGNKLVWTNYKKGNAETFQDIQFSNGELFDRQAAYFLNEMMSTDSEDQLKRAWASLTLVEAAKESITKKREIEIWY